MTDRWTTAQATAPDLVALLWAAQDAGLLSIQRSRSPRAFWLALAATMVSLAACTVMLIEGVTFDDGAPALLVAIIAGAVAAIASLRAASADRRWRKAVRNDPAAFQAMWDAGALTLNWSGGGTPARMQEAFLRPPDDWQGWLSAWLRVHPPAGQQVAQDWFRLLADAVSDGRLVIERPGAHAWFWPFIVSGVVANAAGFAAASLLARPGAAVAGAVVLVPGLVVLAAVAAWRRRARRVLSARLLAAPEGIDRAWVEGEFQLRLRGRLFRALGPRPVACYPGDWRRWIVKHAPPPRQ